MVSKTDSLTLRNSLGQEAKMCTRQFHCRMINTLTWNSDCCGRTGQTSNSLCESRASWKKAHLHTCELNKVVKELGCCQTCCQSIFFKDHEAGEKWWAWDPKKYNRLVWLEWSLRDAVAGITGITLSCTMSFMRQREIWRDINLPNGVQVWLGYHLVTICFISPVHC